MLPPALAVALPGDRPPARTRTAAGQPERQREVDPGLRGVGAVGVLLGPARGEDHRGGRGGQAAHEVVEVGDGDPGRALDPVRPVRADRPAHGVEAVGAGGDVLVVDQVLPDRDVQQAVGQGEVGVRHRLQVGVRELGGGRAPRVDHDVPGTAPATLLEETHRGRHRVGRVAPDEDEHVGLRDVVERERQAAVHPERARAGRDGGRHAEPAVVVDVAAAQRDADELAELVGLLVGQPAPAERADGVPAVRSLRAGDRRGDPVECVVPGRGPKRGIAGVPDERGGEPFGMVEQLGGGRALDAEPTAVDREVGTADQLERAVRPRRERDPALQRAVRAVRGDACGHHVSPVRPTAACGRPR